jgi:hypothetical protein
MASKAECFAKRRSRSAGRRRPEGTAAYLRSGDPQRREAERGILILIGLGLVGLGFLAGVYSDWIATIFALNLGVSIAAVVLARPAVLPVDWYRPISHGFLSLRLAA